MDNKFCAEILVRLCRSLYTIYKHATQNIIIIDIVCFSDAMCFCCICCCNCTIQIKKNAMKNREIVKTSNSKSNINRKKKNVYNV